MSLPSAVLLRTQSDERLVALAREGHERAFEAIVERYRRPLLRACRRVLPEARAEDALQQALLAAWAALQRGDEVRELRAWLFRIAHNTALNQLRISGYDHAELHELLRGGPGPEEEAERRMVVRATLAGLAALPERQRDALLQIAVQGRGQEAVARDLGLSEGAVRQLVHRARVQLRAAATAVTPLPLAAWLASAAPRAATIADRVGDLGAGGGLAGAAAKVGAVAVLAGGAATPAIVHVTHHNHAGTRGAAAAAHHDRGGARRPGVTSSGTLRLVDDRRGDSSEHGGPGPSDGHGGGPGRSGSSGHGGGPGPSGSPGGRGSSDGDSLDGGRRGSSDDGGSSRGGPGSSDDGERESSNRGPDTVSDDDRSGESSDDRSGSSGGDRTISSGDDGGSTSSGGSGSGGGDLSQPSGGDDLTQPSSSGGSASSGGDDLMDSSGGSGSGSSGSDDTVASSTTSGGGSGSSGGGGSSGSSDGGH
jgi:RNA polymerase sigma factor (sigma-70 family)